MKLSAVQIAAIESALAGVASAAGGPVVGAAISAVEGLANQFIPGATPPPPTVVTTPPPVAQSAQVVSTPAVAQTANVTSDELSSLKAQMAEMAMLLKAQQASVASALGSAAAPSTHRDPEPGVGVQPVITDPTAHPILVAAGRAPLVPNPVSDHTTNLDDSATVPNIIDAINALQNKVAALVEACGLGGSAAMAGHP